MPDCNMLAMQKAMLISQKTSLESQKLNLEIQRGIAAQMAFIVDDFGGTFPPVPQDHSGIVTRIDYLQSLITPLTTPAEAEAIYEAITAWEYVDSIALAIVAKDGEIAAKQVEIDAKTAEMTAAGCP